MKRLLAASVCSAAFLYPAVAIASPPTRDHVRQYLRAHAAVRHKYGRRTAGCNLILRRGRCRGSASDQDVEGSLQVLRRMLRPPPPPLRESGGIAVVNTPHGVVATGGPYSGHAACIISHESGGNPQATNGQYAGIGQWSPSSWAHYSHGRYGSSPLNATYSEQLGVLLSEGDAGMSNQQGQYDGCG